MSADCKLCAVLFVEMSTKEGLNYDPATDRVEGVEDMGIRGRTKYICNHAMVVMARGIVGKWKQPLGYFMTSGPMSAPVMKDMLLHAIDKLIAAGFTPLVTICDQ